MKKIWEMFFVLLSSTFCAKRSQHYLGHVLPMFVCLSQLFVAAPLGRFWWNFTQITLSKIWEDIIQMFLKFYLYDVITAFFIDFLCGTLTLPNWEQFSSNWYITYYNKRHCMGLQTSVFRWFLQFNMADQNGENDR